MQKPFPIEFMKQSAMEKVLIALIPLYIFAVGTFGWRILLLGVVTSGVALATEWVFHRKSKKPFTKAVLVSALLFVLTLPPRTPFWVAAIGIIFGVVFAREAFGGFGRNVFNPAAAARAFVYVSFAKYLTAQWTAPSPVFMGGFTRYLTEPIDTLAHSTPMLIYRNTGVMSAFSDLFFGATAGSAGEGPAFLILAAGVYLFLKKVARIETTLSVFVGYFSISFLLSFLGFSEVFQPVWGFLSGGLIFGAVFMATDPITSPKTFEGRLIYGFIIGAVTVVIRSFALFPGGIMFAILIGNTFVPIIDELVKQIKKRGAVHG